MVIRAYSKNLTAQIRNGTKSGRDGAKECRCPLTNNSCNLQANEGGEFGGGGCCVRCKSGRIENKKLLVCCFVGLPSITVSADMKFGKGQP